MSVVSMQTTSRIASRIPCVRSLSAVISAAFLAGACSSTGGVEGLEGLLASAPPASSSSEVAKQPSSELEKAVAYWGEQYKTKPHDLKSALAYARNLKAAGHKEQAFSVLQSAALLHGDSAELASEYGRMALEYDQVAVAEKLLAMADDPMKPDWKVISARGTVLAKQGKYAEAIPFYERALAVSPNQSSVLNNLAMAHAADGKPGKAEEILRRASANSNDPKVKQNLALVLGLQGRHDEAKTVSTASLPAETANADTDYIRRLVKTDPVAAPARATPAVVTQPAPAAPRATPETAQTIEAKSTPDYGWRRSGAPADVGAPAGSWSTSVSRAR